MTPWWKPSSPGEIRPVPWLAPQVVARLESLLEPDWTVIEHGSGGSTLWLAERCKRVEAVEQNLEWIGVVTKQAPKNVVIYSQAPAVLPFCDLLIIDGEPVAIRQKWIKYAPEIVKPGGWVVLDNANRPEYAPERAWLQSVCESYETFDCNENGTLYLVTEFYKLKGSHEDRPKPQ